MKPASPEILIQYFLDYLAEEFRAHPEVRIRRLPQKTRATLEAEHSGEAELNPPPPAETLRPTEGIQLKTRSREALIPWEWMEAKRFDWIQKEIERLKADL